MGFWGVSYKWFEADPRNSMAQKVFLTRPLHGFALSELRARYDVKVHKGGPISRAGLLAGVRGADGLLCFPYDVIDREAIDSAPGLRAISTFSVGFDHIDVEHAKSRKIRVGYTPDVLTGATADLAFGLLLDCMRKISEGDRNIRAGRWTQVYGAYDFAGMDLAGKTLGILGLGRIGRAVAARAAAFGMRVIYHSKRRAPLGVERELRAKRVTFHRLLKESDAISIHVPHTDETGGMFDRVAFETMKDTAYLVNTSRGRVVNEGDLAAALRDGTIAGAGLDVFEREPISRRHPLARLQNAVLTPHIGSLAADTRAAMARLAVRNLVMGLAGKRPAHSVGY